MDPLNISLILTSPETTRFLSWPKTKIPSWASFHVFPQSWLITAPQAFSQRWKDIVQILSPLKSCKVTNLFRRRFAKPGKNDENAKKHSRRVRGEASWYLRCIPRSLIPWCCWCTTATADTKHLCKITHLHTYVICSCPLGICSDKRNDG